jgi:hypothetical protein
MGRPSSVRASTRVHGLLTQPFLQSESVKTNLRGKGFASRTPGLVPQSRNARCATADRSGTFGIHGGKAAVAARFGTPVAL